MNGPVPWRGRPGTAGGTLIGTIERAGLLGRGGAGFPTARKLSAVASGRRKAVVVANGTEGEPVSGKDRTLLGTVPHLVIDGAMLAAEAVGAPEVIVVAHADALAAVEHAAHERAAAGIDRATLVVTAAAPGFVAGEETAVVQWLQKGIAKPTSAPPRPFERGVEGRPTLVQNVETLAHLALIARHGADWFRSVGTSDEPGSMLVTVLGAVASPGVKEVPIGINAGAVLEVAGGVVEPLRALLIGGYFGTFVPSEGALAAPFSRAGLARLGAGVGAGLVVAVPASSCGLVETARIISYLAGESAGQCGPCVFGLRAIADDVVRIATPGRGASGGLDRLERWLSQVYGRGACRHPDGAARLVSSAIATFSSEIAMHEIGHCTQSRA